MKKIICLHKINVLTLKGLFHLLVGLFREGKSLSLLLYFCSKVYPEKVALIQNTRTITYSQFYTKVKNLTCNLTSRYEIKQGDNVAVLSKNTIEFTVTLFALSKMGANIYFINPDIKEIQFKKLCSKLKLDFIVYESYLSEMITSCFSSEKSVPFNGNIHNTIERLMNQPSEYKFKKRKPGEITVLTTGSTGDYKTANRKQSALNFLDPLVALIDEVQLNDFKSIYIPVPIFHGYGLATLIVSVLLGKEIHLTENFEAEHSCNLIAEHKIEVVALVPLMLKRMVEKNVSAVNGVKRILSGGAALDNHLTLKVVKSLKLNLYNLYGTSEAGFCILANPNDLLLNPKTIGKPIYGSGVRISGDEAIGMLEIKNAWSMFSKKNRWVETGDLASIDENNYVYLKGREDSMIISGGENVYPKELEDILHTHEKIELAAVIGVPDYDFGQRLKAIIKCTPNNIVQCPELKLWLRDRVARHQMPISIKITEEFPLTALGEIDKKALR